MISNETITHMNMLMHAYMDLIQNDLVLHSAVNSLSILVSTISKVFFFY